jgi:hypothetical protein
MSGGGQGVSQQSSGQVYGGMPIGNAYASQQQPMTAVMPHPMLQPTSFMGQQQYSQEQQTQRVAQQNPFNGQIAPAQPNQIAQGGLGGMMGGQGVDVIVHGQPFQQQNNQSGIASLANQPMQMMGQMMGQQSYSEMMGMPVYHGGSLYNGPKENLG